MAILRIHCGLETMPDDTKDKVIAPKISGLRAPAAPDISAERKPLLNAFILNFKLSLTLSNKNRQFTFNVIRKAQDAFEEYCRAVDSLKEYVAAGGLALPPYFSAVRHFEHCLAHLYQAVCCMNALTVTWGGEKQFHGGDGSIPTAMFIKIPRNGLTPLDYKMKSHGRIRANPPILLICTLVKKQRYVTT